MTMTNLAMINEVEERINREDNLVKFPVKFTKSKQMFEELDAIIIQLDELKAKAEKLQAEANDTMMEEYMENESYRIAHEFLSTVYKDIDRMENIQIGDGVIKSLRYGNSKAIRDPEGRWFRTITDACKYHKIDLGTFYARKKAGRTLAECLAPERLPRRKEEVIR